MLTRREFVLHAFGAAFYLVATKGSLMRHLWAAEPKANLRQLSASDNLVQLQPGERIQLPDNPAFDQQIRFNYSSRGVHHPRIFSQTHKLCHSKESLIVDEDAGFALIFDSDQSDWYAIYHS